MQILGYWNKLRRGLNAWFCRVVDYYYTTIKLMLIYFDCFNDIIGYPSQLAALKVLVSRPLHNNPNTSSMLKKEALWSRRGNYKT